MVAAVAGTAAAAGGGTGAVAAAEAAAGSTSSAAGIHPGAHRTGPAVPGRRGSGAGRQLRHAVERGDRTL